MKECPKCKRGYGDEIYYCLTDGCYLSQVDDSEETVVRKTPPPTQVLPQTLWPYTIKVKKGFGLGVLLALLVAGGFIIATAIVTGIGYMNLQRQNKSPEVSVAQTPTPQHTPPRLTPTPRPTEIPTPTPAPRPEPTHERESTPNARPAQSILLNPQSISISPGQYYYWTLNVQGRMIVHGDFAASSPVEVYILDQTGFDSFSNNGAAHTYYNSGRTSSKQVWADLPAGRFYLVFNNKFSIITGKNINVTIYVEQ